MPFSIPCNNKKCGKFQEPYLDPLTNQVFCAECNQEITNITSFAKNQMKMFKQFKPEPQGLLVKCFSCNKSTRPILKNDKPLCSKCGKELNLSPHFILMLKQQPKEDDV
jgi:hypothetical protein